MHKADKIKLLSLLGISLILFLSGCVDTSVQPIPSSIDYRSQVNFVNLAAGVGSAAVRMDLKSGGSIDFGSLALGNDSPSNSFKDIPAGAKTFYITYSGGKADTLKTSTETDTKMRLILIGDPSSRTLVKSVKGYIFATKADTNIYPKNVAQVAFFNGSPDDTINTVKVVEGSKTSVMALPDNLTGSSSYTEFTPDTYTFSVTTGAGSEASKSVTLNSQGRYTVIVYDYLQNLKITVLTDD